MYLRMLVNGVYVVPVIASSRAVKMPNCRLPPLTLKPTALGSLLSGSVTVP